MSLHLPLIPVMALRWGKNVTVTIVSSGSLGYEFMYGVVSNSSGHFFSYIGLKACIMRCTKGYIASQMCQA